MIRHGYIVLPSKKSPLLLSQRLTSFHLFPFGTLVANYPCVSRYSVDLRSYSRVNVQFANTKELTLPKDQIQAHAQDKSDNEAHHHANLVRCPRARVVRT